MQNTLQWKLVSPIGSLFLVASEKGLSGIFWEKQLVPMAKKLADNSCLAQAAAELNEYFSGQRKDFSIPLDVIGTEFQKKVWRQLQKIPYGKTYSYKELAEKIKAPKAMRAVGTANGRNPLSIVIPCHRVISADGSIGGYAGGIAKKTKLLNLERL